MATEQLILSNIYQLPENMKLEVLHFVEFLKKRSLPQENAVISKHTRKAGSAKGKYKMANDFNAPLEDFKEYM